MTWEVMVMALAWVLVIEGLGPCLFPRGWRQALSQLLQLPEGQLRIGGFALIAVGLLVLWCIL